MRILTALTVMLMAVALVIGCETDRQPTLAPPLEGDNASTEATTDVIVTEGDTDVVEGVIGPGAMYNLYRPDPWNGDLVVYAHGYVFPFEEVRVPVIDELRDALLAMGYAVAYSSYAENGYAVKEGVIATRQLRGIFASHFGMPEETYLIGNSMGSLISVALGESNRVHYTGLLPTCGIVGGSKTGIDHIYNVRALFDYFYPDVIPGDAQNVPEGLDPFTAAFGLALNAMLTNPFPAFELAGVVQADLQYADPNELIESIVTCIFFHVGSYADLFGRTHGHTFFDNINTAYAGSSDDAALNAGIDRFTSTPDAQNYLEQWYQPTGRLEMPVLTLHTTRDPVVPFSNEAAYAQAVNAAGYGHMLRQYEIDRFGHCTFTTDEMLDAFRELVDWARALEAEEGVRRAVK